MLAQFISEYGTLILYTVITAVFGYLGIMAKTLCNKYLTDKTKRDIAKSCVQFTEQVYHDLSGPEKLEEALKAASAMLAERGIKCTELELRVLIEAALASFNDAFNRVEEKAETEESEMREAEEDAPITFIAYDEYDENGDPVPGTQTNVPEQEYVDDFRGDDNE